MNGTSTEVTEIPNFPLVITDEVIRACGEPSPHPDTLVFGIEHLWAAYAWRIEGMSSWEVYIIEVDELVVKFDVPIGGNIRYSANIYAAPYYARRRPDLSAGAGHKLYEMPRHPLWGVYKQRRFYVPLGFFRPLRGD